MPYRLPRTPYPDTSKKLVDARFSWHEYMRLVNHGPYPEGLKSSKNYGGGYRWDLGVGLDGARKLAMDGWDEGFRHVAKIIAEAEVGIGEKMESIEWRHDVEAAQLDVARFLEGEPECNLVPDVRHIAAQGKLVTLLLNGTVHAHADGNEYLRSGAYVVALVQLLEQAGHSVEVSWALCTYSRGRSETIVRVKDFGDPVNVSRLIFVLAHPAFFRRCGFAYMETWTPQVQAMMSVSESGNYGGVGRPDAKADIIVDMMHQTGALNEEWIQAQLELQGVTIEKEGK